MGDINITPMVDVMLVLLVIFIITAPAMKDSIDVNLPRAKGASSSVGGSDAAPQAVVMDSAGRVHVGARTLEPAEVPGELPKLLKGHEKEMMTLRADRQLPYENVVRVLSIMRGSGVKGVSIAVDAIPVGK